MQNYQNKHNRQTTRLQTWDYALPIPNRFQNPGKNSISTIVGSYKSAVSKHAYRLGFEFEWQTRFHDRIIRDEQAFLNISNYIINNPKKWEKDELSQVP